ncbi:glycoside hydrolase N-terminal domain-containing protein [Paenibacillus sp. HB172176]|uniref:glycosyl hydrolase family 95 catalytic domain-containing protein n=1 Tax=Paenibacillus sp. HB172176 TaxID=2493690 RepID=UPI00143A9697|nr:glycoside hydrolase N-terminal domain-containing protein [Paenibacillus sp. HB172176]
MNSMEQAGKHAIKFEGPASDFFEGALLGNGGLGAVVTTRPDAVVIHFGHNNVWDIRIAEQHQEKIGTFEEIFAKLKRIPEHFGSLNEDPWYKQYVEMTSENYDFPYPRPMPCGSLLLGFDRREVEVLGHRLRIESGLCEIDFLVGDDEATLLVFVDQGKDRLWMKLQGKSGQKIGNLFNRIRILPDPHTPKELPRYEIESSIGERLLSFRQKLPFSLEEGGRSQAFKDRAFRLSVRADDGVSLRESGRELELGFEPHGQREADAFTLCARLEEGLDSDVSKASAGIAKEDAGAKAVDRHAFHTAFQSSLERWRQFWNQSGVWLDDSFLESIWYRNLYFFQCSVKSEATCPGIFANWSYGRIGSEWHGDYHMNYNTQQPFWLAFSSNHVDKHLAYANMVDHVLPVSRKWAKEYYGLRGAYFPHSAYPVEMNMMPYPVPHWGWEVCETPWTVQSLWWHYLYTMDLVFLEERAYAPMKEAALFMVDYMKRADARGEEWGDDRYHIFPTVVPELYELTPGFRKNKDCIVDLTLTKFLFRAFREASEALGRLQEEGELLAEIEDVLLHFPEYPTADSKRGKVFVSVDGEDPEVVYNVPNSVSTVFPGEEHGLHSSDDSYEIAANSYMNHRNEGGNELVFLNMAGARLGKLDLERFKRQISYCMLPNGTCTDMLLESGGRYEDTTPFDYMAPMGIWFENFALSAVINECLLQSYNGILRFFPNWPLEQRAAFATLRAVGGFLVSAKAEAGRIEEIDIVSEAGAMLRIYNPWSKARVIRGVEETVEHDSVLVIETRKGEGIRLLPGN